MGGSDSNQEQVPMRENNYFDVLCNTGDGVYIVDSNRHIVRWNKAAERILQRAETEVLYHDCFRVISGRVSPGKPLCGPNCKIYANVLKGSPQKSFDLWTQANGGESLCLNVSIVAPPAADEPFVAHIFRDTTQKKTELAVDQFLAHLGSSSRADKGSPVDIPGKNLASSYSTVMNRVPAALSSREIEVLTLLAEGLPTKALAQKLNISHFTARNHIQNILVKLDLHSKAQAVSYAFKKGIL
jgi:DNA-binding CsgD family transcriptional regulator